MYVHNYIDINECSEGLSSCNQLCINTIGSYDCDCYTGFNLKSDNKTCLGIEQALLYMLIYLFARYQ